MIVREAVVDDLAAIVSLLGDDGLGKDRETPGDPAYARAFAAMTARPGNVYLVAERDGAIVGCLQFTVIHGLSRKGAARAQIEGVRVAGDCRGMGIGRAMFAAAFEKARNAGCELMQLTTDRRRGEALRFYGRLGFSPSHWGMKRQL